MYAPRPHVIWNVPLPRLCAMRSGKAKHRSSPGSCKADISFSLTFEQSDLEYLVEIGFEGVLSLETFVPRHFPEALRSLQEQSLYLSAYRLANNIKN